MEWIGAAWTVEQFAQWASAAYIGPGAGFAFIGSFLIFLTALLLAVAAILSWPLRALLALVLRKRREFPPEAKRVVILGLDGMDHGIVSRLLEAGRLPRMAALRDSGSFHPLESTCPPISPVAWSTFSTGVNPGKHNIYDFLNRDLRTYQPVLSSARVREGRGRFGRPAMQGLRRSRSLWQVLSDYGIHSTVLRVPITFPPERIKGRLLSAMSVPDLRGTQGTGTYFTTREDELEKGDGGVCVRVARRGNCIACALPGPTLTRRGSAETLSAHLDVTVAEDGAATLRTDGRSIPLLLGRSTPWVRVRFRISRFQSVYGICRFYLRTLDPDFRLYCTPIHIDPERPAMPISYPLYYSLYLAKLQGPFATLGIAEDTWALNENAIPDTAFLEQVYDIHAEREAMFFNDLKLSRSGLCACVFDTPDRIQHMFFREFEQTPKDSVLESMYERMDGLVGRTVDSLRRGDLLLVLSDHGFTSFRRGVNLNSWLRDHQYLALREGAPDSAGLDDIDWSRTRAYALGLSGIYLNLHGREGQGIVDPADAPGLKAEISRRLAELKDPDDGTPAIAAVHDSATTYSGPYLDHAPDLIVGYQRGYRVSWKAALGETEPTIIVDNTKRWSGDHCVDPSLVPGILLANRPLGHNQHPRLMDVAPTVLQQLGIQPPSYMDGRSLDFQSPSSMDGGAGVPVGTRSGGSGLP